MSLLRSCHGEWNGFRGALVSDFKDSLFVFVSFGFRISDFEFSRWSCPCDRKIVFGGARGEERS